MHGKDFANQDVKHVIGGNTATRQTSSLSCVNFSINPRVRKNSLDFIKHGRARQTRNTFPKTGQKGKGLFW